MDNKEYAKECGLRLRRIRMAKNMSQQELADKMFTTPQNVSKWEKEGIRDIDTIKNISGILGQDLLSDERNEEGVVGEIGKHILKKIAENGGFIPVQSLIENYMFGLKSEIVTEEIFKLQKIGMCVREQYKNFYDEEKDMLFITAKGVITLNNLTVFGTVSAKTYEQFLENRKTIQEYYDENKVEKLVRNLHYCGTYRIDYINHLHKRYERVYIDEHENDGCDYGNWMAALPMLRGISFRVDTMFRMIAGLDDSTLSGVLSDLLDYHQWKLCDQYRDPYDPDYIPRFDVALGMFSKKILEWNENIYFNRNGRNAKYEIYYEISDMIKEVEKSVDYFIEKENAFVEGKYSSEWFSTEEVKAFVMENFRSAETDEEKEIDKSLFEINKLDRFSLDYYNTCYVFPDDDCAEYLLDEEWAYAGIEELIRSYYNLPYNKYYDLSDKKTMDMQGGDELCL